MSSPLGTMRGRRKDLIRIRADGLEYVSLRFAAAGVWSKDEWSPALPRGATLRDFRIWVRDFS